MATRKKSKKRTKSKSIARKKAAPKKKPAKKKVSPKKAALNSKPVAKKKHVRKSTRKPKKRTGGKGLSVNSVAYSPAGMGARSGGQSGSLQGLSNREGADSESVDELIEEGNAFEAEVVKGVEDAPDPDEAEVHTHEVLEDDVPGEYDDK
jgi:hypothetical protein